MTYITGDKHGSFGSIERFCQMVETRREDTLIILGDAGFNYFEDARDVAAKEYVDKLPITTFCIHGNHEARPQNIPSYIEGKYHGGKVMYEKRYPNILFAVDGEVYDFDGYKCIAIGGAYSVDKFYRLAKGYGWWTDEQPSAEIKARVEAKLEGLNYKIDIVLSHTGPVKYEPTEVFLKGVDQSTVDKSTEEWLGKIEAKLDYKKWYFGHYHTRKKVDKVQIMFDDFDVLSIK